MKAISLFSGVGGFDLGFERAGIETVLQAEKDPWCLEVLARHWPAIERVNDVRSVGVRLDNRGIVRNGPAAHDESDARTESVDSLGSAAGRVHGQYGERSDSGGKPVAAVDPTQWTRAGDIDFIYGGFPCQDLSVAGKRAGLGGARSGLWFEYYRVLSEMRPTWFCIENVVGLLSSAGGRDFGVILNGLDELGYGVAWAVLDARHFGVPQRRRRVFIVGCLGNPDAAAAVLAVCEGCEGDTPSSAASGQRVAGSLTPGAHPSGFNGRDAFNGNLVASTLRSRQSSARVNMPGRGGEDDANLVIARSQAASNHRLDGDSDNFIAGSLRASDGHHGHSSPRGDGSDNLIATVDFRNVTSKTNRTRVEDGLPANTLHAEGLSAVLPTGVRRLTPLECERLMGWPDEHTRWTADGREIPDSHRYRMCGNGVVATCAEWIGWRLMAVDALLRSKAAA